MDEDGSGSIDFGIYALKRNFSKIVLKFDHCCKDEFLEMMAKKVKKTDEEEDLKLAFKVMQLKFQFFIIKTFKPSDLFILNWRFLIKMAMEP